MAKPSLTVLQKSYLKRVYALQKNNKSFRDLLATVQATGDNYVAQKRRLEDKVFDVQWVEELELGFASIDRIMANPRKFIKEQEEVVLAALAKRITSASITHLASHTQFVHSVDRFGNVTPERILSISTEEDIQIYENRFVMSLIQKLAIFIEKRYQFIRSHGETRNSDVLLIHSKTEIDGVRYEVDNRIKVSVPSSDNGMAEKNDELLKKIGSLRERVVYYLHCPFMQEMSGAKPVHNPIAITNMLLKNPDYHKAYELWRFIDNYEKLGVTYSVKETNQTFDQSYFKEIYALILADMLTLKAHEIEGRGVSAPGATRRKVLEPKTLLTLEDETFLDGRFAYDQFPELKALIEPKGELAKKEGEERLAPTPEMVRLMREMASEKQKRDLIKAKEIRDRQQSLRDKQEREEAEQAVLRKKKLDELVAKAQAQEAAVQKKEEERRLRELEAQKAKEAAVAFVEEERLLAQARNEIFKVAATDRVIDKKIAEEIAHTEAIKEASKKTAEAISARVEETPVKFPTPQEAANSLEAEAGVQAPEPEISGPSLDAQVAPSLPQTAEAENIEKPSIGAMSEPSEIPSSVLEPPVNEIPSILSQANPQESGTPLFAEAPTSEEPKAEQPKIEETEVQKPKIAEPLSPSSFSRGKVLFVLDKAERAIPAPEDKPVLYFSAVKNPKTGEAAPSGVKRVSLNPFANGISIKNIAKVQPNPIVTPKEEPKVVMTFAVKKDETKPAKKPTQTPLPNPPVKRGLFIASPKPKTGAAPSAVTPSPKKVFWAKNEEDKHK
jgi:hypothetical protein